MNQLNNYRFGSYALLAMGLINLRYQSGSDGNLSSSSLLILTGLLVFLLTFIPRISYTLLNKSVKRVSLILFIALVVYGILI